MKRTLCALLVLSSSASAALIPRLDGQAVYDTVTDVTWLADANLAATQTFGVSGIDTQSGRMNAFTAQNWFAALNAADYLGTDNWRAPALNNAMAIASGHCTPFAHFAHDVCTTSELTELYYTELGAAFPSFHDQEIIATDLRGDHGPFHGIQGVYLYYDANLNGVSSSISAFTFINGSHDPLSSDFHSGYIWAVRTGDIAWTLVSEPGTPTLLALALGVAWLGLATHKRKKAPQA